MLGSSILIILIPKVAVVEGDFQWRRWRQGWVQFSHLQGLSSIRWRTSLFWAYLWVALGILSPSSLNLLATNIKFMYCHETLLYQFKFYTQKVDILGSLVWFISMKNLILHSPLLVVHGNESNILCSTPHFMVV